MSQPPFRKPVNQSTIDLLLTRRSLSVSKLSEPGPDASELETILRAATRVPDHGKLAPWRIIVVQGERRATLGEAWAQVYASKNPDASAEQIEFERKRPLRAPLMLAVHTRITNLTKIPRWEQVLTGANVCMNALTAANALGYYTAWISEWVSYDTDAKVALGIPADDEVIGYLYIGSGQVQPEERPRPTLEEVVSYF